MSDRALTLSVELTAAGLLVGLLALAEWDRVWAWLRERRGR